MNEWAAALQAAHLAAAMVLLGEAVFALVIARPALMRLHPAGIEGASRRLHHVACWALALSLACGAAWVVVKAAVMSGLTPWEVLSGPTLGLALVQTGFGRISLARAGVALALGLSILVLRRSESDAVRAVFRIATAAFALVYLGSLAWVGHAGAGEDTEDVLHIGADVAHLIAAGCWLGALPALVSWLHHAATPGLAADAARRFSMLGLVSVGLLTASGLVNTWYLVGSIPGLVGTSYGHLLIAKLALFSAMLGLAAVNRGIAARPANGAESGAWALLRRNALVEIALGIGVVAVVGFLGSTVPAVHEPATWPFARTLSTSAIEHSAWGQLVVTAATASAGFAALVLIAGALDRQPRIRLAALAGVVIPLAGLAFLLAVPANPTTYHVSPVPYDTRAIASGFDLYIEHCSGCHGSAAASGPADNTDSRLPAQARMDITEQVPDRREGDLFWSIAHGVPGTSMPGFAARMSTLEIWQLVQFLDARASARNALAMADRIRPLRSVPAPDFTYEVDGGEQRSLLGQPQGEDPVTLLVLFSLPSSLPRLHEIAAQLPAFIAAGARVIALPMPGSPPLQANEQHGEAATLLARADPATASVYLMFTRRSGPASDTPHAHIEYLIDRFGYLRVRRTGAATAADGHAGTGTSEAIAQDLPPVLPKIRALASEPARVPPQWGHRH